MIHTKIVMQSISAGEWFTSFNLKDASQFVQSTNPFPTLLSRARFSSFWFCQSLAPRTFTRVVTATLAPLVDSAVVGCIRGGEEGEYRALVDNFVEWSEQNHLRRNVNKTREMVIDFGRKKRMPSQPLRIRGEVVEEVEDYKYLGVVIDNRLDWKSEN